MSSIDTVFFDIGGVLVELEFELTHRGFLAGCSKPQQFDAESGLLFFMHYFSKGELGKVSDRFVCGGANEDEFLRAAREALSQDFGYRGDEAQVREAFNLLIGKAIAPNVAVLTQLARTSNLKVGVISDTNSCHVEAIKRQIPEVFKALPPERIFVSNEVGCLKRDGARIFEICLEKIGSKPQTSLMIDDFPRNLEYARGLGMQTVQVTPETDLRAELRKRGVEC